MNEEVIADKVFFELKNLLTPESLAKVISLLFEKERLQKNKVVVILAGSPSLELEKEVTSEAKKLFGHDAIIEYSVNPQIVGGFILEGRGRYYDYSLNKRINNLFKNE